MTAFARIRQHAALLLVFLMYLPACTAWRVHHLPVPEVITQRQPTQLRITRLDGTRAILINPHVVSDSVVGASPPPTPENRVAVALADVRQAESRQVHAGKTAGMVIGIAGGAVLTFILVVCNVPPYC